MAGDLNRRQIGSNRKRGTCLLCIALLALIGIFFRSTRLKPVHVPGSEAQGFGGNRGFSSRAWQPVLPEPSMMPIPDFRAASEINSLWHRAPRYSISGHVLSANGSPIAGATVTLYASLNPETWRGEEPITSTSTNGLGSYEILSDEIPKGPLFVEKTNHATRFSFVVAKVQDSLRRDFVLEKASASVRGRVTDTHGNPVPGIRIMSALGRTMRAEGYQVHAPFISDVTNSRGQYQLNMPAGQTLIGVEDERFISEWRSVEIQDQGVKTVDLVAQRVARLKVTDTQGNPVVAKVTKADGMAWERQPIRDSEGYIAIPINSSAQELNCRLSAKGFITRSVTLDPQNIIHVALKKNVLVSGTVTDVDGKPIGSVRVRIETAETLEDECLTDTVGFFSMARTELPPTKIWVTKTGYADREIAIEPSHMPDFLNITLLPAEVPLDPAPVLSDGGRGGISGRVIDSSGRPCLLFSIAVVPLDGRDIGRYRDFISVDGSFLISGLPEGIYTVFARRQDDWVPNIDSASIQIEIRRAMIQGPILLLIQSSR